MFPVQFHLEQAKARTQQRLREGRPKPIDVIVRNLYFPDDMDADAADPYEVAKSLTLPELRELTDDVQNYQVNPLAGCIRKGRVAETHPRQLSCREGLPLLSQCSQTPTSTDHAQMQASATSTILVHAQELDKYDQQHVHFWNAMATVATHELDEAQRQEDIDRARVSTIPDTCCFVPAFHTSLWIPPAYNSLQLAKTLRQDVIDWVSRVQSEHCRLPPARAPTVGCEPLLQILGQTPLGQNPTILGRFMPPAHCRDR